MRWNFSDSISESLRTFAQLRNTYRPELHYMRGPGPKWHAKRAGIATKPTARRTDPEPALDIAKARA
jgi:hypothetical protein